MNNYPYPVLTELDSAYKSEFIFNIGFKSFSSNEGKIKVNLEVKLNSNTLKKYISDLNAELIVKIVSGLKTETKVLNEVEGIFELELDCENIKENDDLKITAYVIAKNPFIFEMNDEIKDLFGEDYKIKIRKYDILAISNTENLSYSTSDKNFIRFVGSKELNGKGFEIKLDGNNYITIMVGVDFNKAYGLIKTEKYAPLFESNIVYETIVYTLVELVQNQNEYKNNEWYKLFVRLFEENMDEKFDEFVQNFKNDKYIDISKIYRAAHSMTNNAIESFIIKTSNLNLGEN